MAKLSGGAKIMNSPLVYQFTHDPIESFITNDGLPNVSKIFHFDLTVTK